MTYEELRRWAFDQWEFLDNAGYRSRGVPLILTLPPREYMQTVCNYQEWMNKKGIIHYNRRYPASLSEHYVAPIDYAGDVILRPAAEVTSLPSTT